ncbi:MAG: HAMP domain-containing sensor histidine kinase [bacterium]
MDTNQDMEKLKAENERLAKLYAAKSDLVSLSVHQVRTSLSAIKWIIKMFLDGDLGTSTPEQQNLLAKAYETNDRAINIVSELLVANKAEEIMEKDYAYGKVDIKEMIDSAVFDFSGEAYEKGIEVIFLKPEMEIPHVRADREKLRVVLQNLLENAIKYSNKHGKIFITLVKDGGFCQVSVKDTGVGISEEGKKKIFEKFYRDPEAQKQEIIGSGMGLFTTKNIVETHGGKIWFDSKDKEGTTFFFTIPIAE